MSSQMSLWDTHNATSSQESESGAWHSETQVGQMIERHGRDHAHVNLSPRQAREKGLMMSATCGRTSIGSSSSGDLQSFLESKFRARLSILGSTLYRLTWKPWITPSGVLRSRLRASALRTSETDLSGWPTPTTRDHKDSGDLSRSMTRKDGKLRNDTLPRALWLHIIGTGSATQEQMEYHASCHLILARELMSIPREWDDCSPNYQDYMDAIERAG